jgi:predicted GIY-YIG superfamily endonuclease
VKRGGEKVALYRHFNRANELLYVGISSKLPERMRQHQRGSKWFFDVKLVTVEWFDDRQSAKLAEGKAIRTEQPKFNILKGKAEPKLRDERDPEDNKTVFMKIRVTKQEQAEWRDICRALGQDFSSIVRDTMKRRSAIIKKKQEAEQ